MRHPSRAGWRAVTRILFQFVPLTFILLQTPALAYEQYSADRNSGNCADCHGGFRSQPYISLSDGQSWGDDLHDVHRFDMINGDCDTCHTGNNRFPVFLGSSNGGTGLAGYACAGCHGRQEDFNLQGTALVSSSFRRGLRLRDADRPARSKAAPGQRIRQRNPRSSEPPSRAASALLQSTGFAAGLRQHHWRSGVTVCLDCHGDADPNNMVLAGEDVLPPYYANPGTNHPDIPGDSCNPSPGFPENFAATMLGLDNDGDLLYDGSDADCGGTVCGDGMLDAGEECDDGNTVGGDCCSATCTFEMAGSVCDDGLFCTVGETCDGSGSCSGGGARSCADAVACTLDTCDEAGDTCVNAPDDSACDNGAFCDGVETCDGALGCQAGTPVDCADAVACTLDSCDEAGDACVNAPDDAACSNSVFCDGAEVCDPGLGCQAGPPVNCNDSNICTDDACNETAVMCENVFDPNNDPSCLTGCGNGIPDAGEECDDGNTVDGDCCSATCTFEMSGSVCDDGLFCTVGESCDGAGSCAGGGARSCADAISCTIDSCDESGDACINAPDDPACDNGAFCDGMETCDAVLGCQAGTLVDCDDGVSCTTDSCDEAGDTCVSMADDLLCDDGLFCNGGEICDLVLDCQSGTPVDCDDSDICTDDSCNETATMCDNIFDPGNDPTCQAMCPDLDGDGFSSSGGVCGPVDCDDGDAAVNPDATETCDDDVDNDCDGLFDAADESCEFNGDVEVRTGPLLDPAYAGSTACGDCHARQYRSWKDTLHARMLIRPGDAQAAGFPLPPAGPAGVSIRSWSDVLFLIGQKWKTHFVDTNGMVQGMQWNYLLGRWDTLDGGTLQSYDCGGCHTTGFDPNAVFLDPRSGAVAGVEGSWVEYGIGCEACHGPGAEHAARPTRGNINRIFFDWYDPNSDGMPDPVDIRSALVCANCHARGNRFQLQTDLENHEQFNDWQASPHSSTLRPTALNTYCAQCHSPGNADYFASEHNFTNFEPSSATHVACISCHNPHATSQQRWSTLFFPPGGRQDPRKEPARIARYRGSDGSRSTDDYETFDNLDSSGLCRDCHSLMAGGFRRHKDGREPEFIVLSPPFNQGMTFTVPHREHVEEGRAGCIDCHMHPSRTSINEGDVRSHTLWPNEWRIGPTGGLWHFADTCGQCHREAEDCSWCHSDF